MDGNNSEQPNQEKKINAELLTALSRERFRRAMLISSRIMALLLIAAIIYMGYVQLQYGKFLKTKDSCYICGYEYNKQCGCVYISETEMQYLSDDQIKQIKQDRTEYNSQECRQNLKVSDALKDNEIIFHPSSNLTTQ